MPQHNNSNRADKQKCMAKMLIILPMQQAL